MAERGEEMQPSLGVTSATYPLNSRRISATYLHRIAKELGLPTTAGLEELRVMIDEKLRQENHEPRNVQVGVGQAESGALLWLRDEGAVFLIVSLSIEQEGKEGKPFVSSTPSSTLSPSPSLIVEEDTGDDVKRDTGTTVLALEETLAELQALLREKEGELDMVREEAYQKERESTETVQEL